MKYNFEILILGLVLKLKEWGILSWKTSPFTWKQEFLKIFSFSRQGSVFSLKEWLGWEMFRSWRCDPQHPSDASQRIILLHTIISTHSSSPGTHDSNLSITLRQPLASAEQFSLGDIPQPVPPDLTDQLSHSVTSAIYWQHQRQLSQAGAGSVFCSPASLPSSSPPDSTKFDFR